jgi:hypothetical protein
MKSSIESTYPYDGTRGLVEEDMSFVENGLETAPSSFEELLMTGGLEVIDLGYDGLGNRW